MHNEFQQSNYAFETAVLQLQKDLQFLIDEDRVSQRFINKQNAILKCLITYQQVTHQYIDFLEAENAQVRIERRNYVQTLHSWIQRLEAICILHGVTDIPYWMHKETSEIQYEAQEAYQKSRFAVPYELKERIAKLPVKEQKYIRRLLFKNEVSELQQLLKEYVALRKQIEESL